jgi:hypothetical protein
MPVGKRKYTINNKEFFEVGKRKGRSMFTK